jgi:MAF protein
MKTTKRNQASVILASSSPYRAELLSKLGIRFSQIAPNIDETPLADESADNLVKRLTCAKAMALCVKEFGSGSALDSINISDITKQKRIHIEEETRNKQISNIIIASDQVALTKDRSIIGKAHNKEKAIEQLMSLQGQRVEFLTGLCVLALESSTTKTNEQQWKRQFIAEPYTVYFKQLSRSQIARYVEIDNPIDCAGSFKSEGFGISLFEKFEGEDPNSLVGLPLIKLCTMLNNIGFDVLA